MSDSKQGLLGLGSHGPAVADVRARLAGLPADQLPEGVAEPSGDPAVFDEGLERAVRAFQQHKGLIVDGVVGGETFAAIDGARWALGDRILTHTPGHLLRGEDVVALQERLNTLGFSVGRVDGRFGPHTEAAGKHLRSYADPVDETPADTWLATMEPVIISRGGDMTPTGWVVVVQGRQLDAEGASSLPR